MYAAVCVIEDGEGNFLSVSRRGVPEDRGFPGGKIDSGETPEEAAIREAFEETGLQVSGLTPIYYSRGVQAFWVKSFKGEPRQMEPGITVSWRPMAELVSGRCTFADFNRRVFRSIGLDPG